MISRMLFPIYVWKAKIVLFLIKNKIFMLVAGSLWVLDGYYLLL